MRSSGTMGRCLMTYHAFFGYHGSFVSDLPCVLGLQCVEGTLYGFVLPYLLAGCGVCGTGCSGYRDVPNHHVLVGSSGQRYTKIHTDPSP